MKSVFNNLFSTLFGDQDQFELEHRLFNAVCLLGGITAVINSGFNFLVKLNHLMIGSTAALGLLLLGCYYIARVRKTFRMLVWPALLTTLACLCLLWFVNGGTRGAAQYFFLVAGMISCLLLPQKGRIFITALYMLTITGLVYVEYVLLHQINRPDLILKYDSPVSRYLDVGFSFAMSLFLLNFIIIIFIKNFYQVFEKVQEYKTHFYEDLVLARILQERIFEYDPELVEDFDLALVYLPSAELSGDLYDFSRPSKNCLRIFMADARGHGINSSLSSMLIKSEWTNLNRLNYSPDAALERLNTRIVQRYGDSISFSGIITDIYEDRIVFASGGHVTQYVIHNGAVHELMATGSLIGILDDADYQLEEVPFPSGARLVLFTDALTEETDKHGKAIGYDWLLSTVRGEFVDSANMGDTVIQGLATLKGQNVGALDCKDDLTFIAVSHKENDSVFQAKSIQGFSPFE